MDQQSELESKRREAREEILALKERIPSARIIKWFGRLLSKGATNRSFLYWLSNFIFINLGIFWIWVPVGLVMNELEQRAYLWKAALLATEMQFAALLLNYSLLRMLLDNIADQIVEKINKVDDLSRFASWLNNSWSTKNVALFVLAFWMIWIFLGIGAISITYQAFVGFGFSLVIIFIGLLAGIAFHGVYWLNLLISNLRTYQYDLNVFFPASSEIITNISDMLNNQLYGLAIYFAFYTLLGSTNLVEKQIQIVFAIPFFIISWTAIISQFVLARTTLGHIINNAKWKMLNKIQAQINSIEAKSDLSDKVVSEKLLRLVDLHGRVMASKSNIFDLKSISTFFSQLMLPLLGLLLGNLDKVLELLR
jgi:hypothetical protein